MDSSGPPVDLRRQVVILEKPHISRDETRPRRGTGGKEGAAPPEPDSFGA